MQFNVNWFMLVGLCLMSVGLCLNILWEMKIRYYFSRLKNENLIFIM